MHCIACILSGITSLFLHTFLTRHTLLCFVMNFISDTHFRNCYALFLWFHASNSFAEVIFIIPLQQLHCTRHSSHSIELHTHTPPIPFNAFRHFESRGHGFSQQDHRERFFIQMQNAKSAHTNTTIMCINMFLSF